MIIRSKVTSINWTTHNSIDRHNKLPIDGGTSYYQSCGMYDDKIEALFRLQIAPIRPISFEARTRTYCDAPSQAEEEQALVG